MRVGVYIDGFNLYYGGRGLIGDSGVPGWRWLDLRQLCDRVIAAHSGWAPSTSLRVVYCTARVRGSANQTGAQDQDVYLRALSGHGSVDVIEHGTYVSRVATSPLAVRDRRGRPVLVVPDWPVMVQDSAGAPVPGARFMA